MLEQNRSSDTIYLTFWAGLFQHQVLTFRGDIFIDPFDEIGTR